MEYKLSLRSASEHKIQSLVVESIRSFVNEKPEIIFEWHDKYSDAVGYLVINSLKNGAAGGGTRVHKNVELKEVIALAKTMEMKFSISGPCIGGAKTGIRVDPNHPDKYQILKRWFTEISPILKSCYGTGSDLNTDIHQINKILGEIGIQHAQEGIINNISPSLNTNQLIKSKMAPLSAGINLSRTCKIKASELVTGYGVAESTFHYLNGIGQNLEGKRVVVQGAGNVGAAAAYFLNQRKANIIAISDKDGAKVSKLGLSSDGLLNLLNKRSIFEVFQDGMISHNNLDKWLSNEEIDIFIPAAESNLIGFNSINTMISNGLQLISCGANNPFIEEDLCYGICSQYIDRNLTLIPDFIANSGMARAFNTAMSSTTNLSTGDIFKDVSSLMKSTMKRCIELNDGKLVAASAYELAMNNQVVNNQAAA